MTSIDQTLVALVEPLVAGVGAELIDVEHVGGVVRVTIDQPGGVGIDALSKVSRVVSRALDDADPIPGRYTLEVSSPGVERPLRTPAQFERAIGERINVKTDSSFDGPRRVTGTLLEVGDGAIVVSDDAEPATSRTIPFAHLGRARTVFEWGPGPKPGKGSRPGSARRSAKAGSVGPADPATST